MALSARERQRQSIIQDRRRIKIERQTERVLAKEFRRMSKQVTEDYIAGGEPRAQVGLEVHQENIKVILFDAYRKSSISSAQYLNDYFGKCFRGRIEKKDMFSFWDNPDLEEGEDDGHLLEILGIAAFLAMFRRRALIEARLITNTTRETLVRSSSEADEDNEDSESGLSATQMALLVGSAVALKNRARPRTISRTEVGTALGTSQFEIISRMELPPMVKVWNAIIDGRTRTTHRRANGDRLNKDELFRVGRDRMKYPGDPSAHIENLANCRCVLTWEPAEVN